MEKSNRPAGKAKKIIYWIFTLWLALGMVSTGVLQLRQMKEGPGAADSMVHLGYPAYLLTMLGICKVLGVIVLLIPKFPILKEWVYAGLFFMMAGAIYSHMAVGDPFSEIFPSLLLLILVAISWYSRPVDRKIIFC